MPAKKREKKGKKGQYTTCVHSAVSKITILVLMKKCRGGLLFYVDLWRENTKKCAEVNERLRKANMMSH